MAYQDTLIKEVAQEIGWSQADVKRAISQYGDVNSKEEIYACCLRYSGSELKKRNYQIGAQKRINAQQKNMIENLVHQLTNVQDFYENQLVPTLKETINSQAAYIKDLLRGVQYYE